MEAISVDPIESLVVLTSVCGKNRFTPELNEKEVIELLENATPGSIKKASKYDMKIIISRKKL